MHPSGFFAGGLWKEPHSSCLHLSANTTAQNWAGNSLFIHLTMPLTCARRAHSLSFSPIHFQQPVMLRSPFRDQTNWLMTLMSAAVSGQSRSKKVPRKTFPPPSPLPPPPPPSSFKTIKMSFCREIQSSERWERRSILCLVSWNAFEVSVTLKTHQHMAQGKVRASLRVGTSSMFWRISHSGPWRVTQ